MKLTWVIVIFLALFTCARGQFLVDHGRQGTFKSFRGQIRNTADAPVSGAIINVKNIKTDAEITVEADEDGYFEKILPSGEYSVSISPPGFNAASFSIRINTAGTMASRKYLIVSLGPGCGSGGSLISTGKRPKKNPI